MMRPVLARTSSAASGLRFCGMMEEPLVNRSESAIRPTSGEHQTTISSAKRDKCTGDGGGGERLQDEIAVGHGIERIRHRRFEPERLRRRVPVDRECGARERSGAERTKIR